MNNISISDYAATSAIYFTFLSVTIIILLLVLSCCIFCCSIYLFDKKHDCDEKFNFINYNSINKVNRLLIIEKIKSENKKINNDNDNDEKKLMFGIKKDVIEKIEKEKTEKELKKKSRKCCSFLYGKKDIKKKQVTSVVIDETKTYTELEGGQNIANKKIFIMYTFDNLNESSKSKKSIYSKISNDIDNPFDNLESFVQIVLKTFDPNTAIILLKISSPGGYAYQFELAYTHLTILRKAGFNIIALIDDICASGGYMLASACNKIICSEYATIGSVGVVISMYNYHELIKKIGIIEKTLTTGPYKRTFPSGEELEQHHIDKTNEGILETLDIFKLMVKKGRSLSDQEIEDILSAKCWYGKKALEKKLVDEISSSIEYLDKLIEKNNIVFVVNNKKKSGNSIINSILDVSMDMITDKIHKIFIKNRENHVELKNYDYVDKII
jgi:serine protease SohB